MSLLQIILLFGSLIFAFILFYIIVPYKNIQSYRSKGFNTFFFPILGEIKVWLDTFNSRGDTFAKTKESRREFPGQKVAITNLANKTLILIRDPQYAKDFFINPQNYKKVGVSNFLRPLVGYGGLVLSEGETWKRHRKIISNSFHYESLRTNLSVVQGTTKEFFNKLTPEDYKNYTVIPKIQEITGEVVGRIFFGEHLASYTLDGKPLTGFLAEFMSELTLAAFHPLSVMFEDKMLKYPILPSYRRLKNKIDRFRALCFQIVKDRKASEYKGKDLLASLLETQNSPDVENRLSDADIVNEFITFFVAGMDTTGHLISMTLYILTKHPEYYAILQKERDELYNTEEQVTADTLQKMDELHGVLKDALRFYTPAVMVFYRMALKDHTLGGDFPVKKGQWLKTEFMSMFHDEKHFEKPEVFDPKRWIEGNDKKLDPYAWTPFSAGPRNCIGQHLAIAESKVIISEFLERFDYKMKNEKYELKMIQRFLYEPFEEMVFELKPKVK